MGEAGVLVFPSIWYEGLPKTIIESFARGTPIIASRIGSMIDLIDHDVNGLHVPPGDPAALAAATRMLIGDSSTLARMRAAARKTFVDHYTAEENYRRLVAIYDDAIATRHGRSPAAV